VSFWVREYFFIPYLATDNYSTRAMKILLLGEYSNVHWTLAEGLRQLGHEVTVASNGDFWKDYPRDVDLNRRPGALGRLDYMLRLLWYVPRMTGFDIVQLINPMFLELKAEHIAPVYRYLRRHNRRLVLGAFGMDYYWVHENSTRMPLRYSDFNIGSQRRTDAVTMEYYNDWIDTPKGNLNVYIAKDCDAIVAGLYEYWVTYQPLFPDKTTFIPFPIRLTEDAEVSTNVSDGATPHPLRLFLGINRSRSVYKGTDIMLQAAQDAVRDHSDKITLQVVENVPFARYRQLMQESDAILDQLYSYTPSMNPLEAMSHGIICIGGGEPENYEILHETELRPIINVQPDYQCVYDAIVGLATHPERISGLKRQSIRYVRKHHDYVKVARQYEQLYRSLLARS